MKQLYMECEKFLTLDFLIYVSYIGKKSHICLNIKKKEKREKNQVGRQATILCVYTRTGCVRGLG